jgi:glutathione peroxidase
MKTWIFVTAGILFIAGVAYSYQKNQNEMEKSIHEYKITLIDGEEIALSSFKGKKILFVNVASECGFTPQYAELEKLHREHGDKLVVIGMPCNQFGGQEPGTHEEIKAFCQKNYGVTFQITQKVEVKGPGQHPVFRWLTRKELNGVESTTVKWNFQKYMVDEDGEYLEMFLSNVSPLSIKLTGLL